MAEENNIKLVAIGDGAVGKVWNKGWGIARERAGTVCPIALFLTFMFRIFGLYLLWYTIFVKFAFPFEDYKTFVDFFFFCIYILYLLVVLLTYSFLSFL